MPSLAEYASRFRVPSTSLYTTHGTPTKLMLFAQCYPLVGSTYEGPDLSCKGDYTLRIIGIMPQT